MWAAVVYLPFTMKYFLMICVLVVPFSDCGTVNINGHPTPLKPDTQVPTSSKLTNTHHHTSKSDHHHNHHDDGRVNTHHHNDGKVNTHHHKDGQVNTHHHTSKSSKSTKPDHHHNHHQAAKKSGHRHPSPVKVSKLDHRPKVSKLSKSRKPIVAVFPPKSSAVWARQKAAYSGHPSHNVVYSGKPAHHVPYSAQAKKSSIRPRYPLRAPLPRAAPRPIPLRRKHINPLQRLFGQHERAQRHPTRLVNGPPAKLRHPQRVPVPNFVYLPAEQLPGYETFKLHEVIRKPDVIHYVDSPEIQTTQKPEEEEKVEEKYKEKVVVKKEIKKADEKVVFKKADQISELIDERSAKKPKEFELR